MDCSTFSFDLHVLGAPPALILSRDQTLVRNDRVLIAPALLRLLTSLSLLHPTRLSKICAHSQGIVIPCWRAGLETCGPQPDTSPHGSAARKTLSFKKNQTGRPYSAPHGGPSGVLLPFLTEDLHPYITACPNWQVRTKGYNRNPQLGDLNRISEAPPVRKRYYRKITNPPRKALTY